MIEIFSNISSERKTNILATAMSIISRFSNPLYAAEELNRYCSLLPEEEKDYLDFILKMEKEKKKNENYSN